MKLQKNPPLHLTYCMNVHPGESWKEQFAAVRDEALKVKRLVGRPGLFGLGLRVSWRAAQTLAVPARLEEFREFCSFHDLYVFTINGFPYGSFHGASVKADVYRPDWRNRERLDYTNLLTDILAAMLPNGVSGSISTVPGSYKTWIETGADVRAMARNIAEAAMHAAQAEKRTGKSIAIALEPEPDGFIENTDEAIEFFKGPLADYGGARLRSAHGLSATDAQAVLARHVGMCVDTAHMTVAFENPAESLATLRDAGVSVSKVHLGSSLRVPAGADARSLLKSFCEDVYLHQTRRRSADGAIHAFADLSDALAVPANSGDEWRVHFHVPLDFEGRGGLCSTRFLLTRKFAELVMGGVTEHVEIETYTYGVLPADMVPESISKGIAREYRWALSRLFGSSLPY